MSKERVRLSDQVRAAVDASGLSRYRIAKKMGIAESTMSRFMSGSGLTMEHLDLLADLLKLNITTDTKTHKDSKQPKG